MMKQKVCPYGYGVCNAPNTACLYWVGTFCFLDKEMDDGSAER